MGRSLSQGQQGAGGGGAATVAQRAAAARGTKPVGQVITCDEVCAGLDWGDM